MLVEIAVILGSIIPATVIGARMARDITEWQPFVAVMQAVIGAMIGLAAVEFILLPLWVAAATTLASQTVNVIAKFTKTWNSRRRSKALNGDYGEATMWAAEIAQDGDTEFTMAVQALPKSERQEILIIAESKQELRELTIERFEKLADDIPEDFA